MQTQIEDVSNQMESLLPDVLFVKRDEQCEINFKLNASTELLVDSIEQFLDVITTSVATISEMNLQIAHAAKEQSTVADEINKNIIEINSIAEETTAGSQQITQASSELNILANELNDIVSQFKV